MNDREWTRSSNNYYVKLELGKRGGKKQTVNLVIHWCLWAVLERDYTPITCIQPKQKIENEPFDLHKLFHFSINLMQDCACFNQYDWTKNVQYSAIICIIKSTTKRVLLISELNIKWLNICWWSMVDSRQ